MGLGFPQILLCKRLLLLIQLFETDLFENTSLRKSLIFSDYAHPMKKDSENLVFGHAYPPISDRLTLLHCLRLYLKKLKVGMKWGIIYLCVMKAIKETLK